MGVYGHDMDQRRHDGDWVMVDVSLPFPSDDDEHAPARRNEAEAQALSCVTEAQALPYLLRAPFSTQIA